MIANAGVMVNAAVSEVFTTMLNLEVRQVSHEACGFKGEPQIASAVGFTGRVSGVVYLYTTVRFAVRITRGLLGLNASEAHNDDMVNDAMGEIANMIVGQFKSRLTDRGLPCVMTIPSIVRGSQFEIEAVRETEVDRLGFACGEDYLLVEVLLQKCSGSES
jgi:chemotaxis protein CheX